MVRFRLEPKYYFGKGCITKLPSEIKRKQYKNVLLLSGKSSIKKNGIYNEIMGLMHELDAKVYEFMEITPNPKVCELDAAVNICRQNKIDLILAVGGGSVIDAAKVIATVATTNIYQSSWDYVLEPSKTKEKPIDIISVITIAGTASENNGGSVITNEKLNIKYVVNNAFAVPKVCFIDPTYTQTLSQWQLASGIFDCFNHCLDQYLGSETFEWTNKYLLMNAANIYEYGTKLFKGEDNYEVRENISWTASMALNSLSTFNNQKEDWNTHVIEHALSGIYDVTHGAGLAFIFPSLLTIKSKYNQQYKDKAIRAAKYLFNVDTIEGLVEHVTNFIKLLNLPLTWKEFNIDKPLDVDKLMEHINYTSHNSLSEQQKQIYQEILLDLKNK